MTGSDIKREESSFSNEERALALEEWRKLVRESEYSLRLDAHGQK